MGLIANYMMVDEAELDRMMEMDGEALVERINELEEDEDQELYCMDKLWDGLHFLLTGVSASKPIEGGRLSEAIVGVHAFDTDDEDFVSRSGHDELKEIVRAMEAVDFAGICAKADFAAFRKNKIYPKIWKDTEKEQLLRELSGEFQGLLSFYKSALEKRRHIIVSIF